VQDGFADVIRVAESAYGAPIPSSLQRVCWFAFHCGAIEAATLIECHGATTLSVARESMAALQSRELAPQNDSSAQGYNDVVLVGEKGE
jgi:hypothetical protein